MNRNNEWLDIWEKKYKSFDFTKDLHVLDGFDGMSKKEWQNLVNYFLDIIKIEPEDAVLEVGCGSGAFINEIGRCKELSGIDYSEDAIEAIKKMVAGNFIVAEANTIPFQSNSFDKVLSFAVFFYFSSYEYAREAFIEMLRVMKPDGTLFIGDINDLDKKELAITLREESDGKRKAKYLSKKKVDHLYFPKSFFQNLANEHNMEITFIEQNKELAFYYNSQYRYSILMHSKTSGTK